MNTCQKKKQRQQQQPFLPHASEFCHSRRRRRPLVVVSDPPPGGDANGPPAPERDDYTRVGDGRRENGTEGAKKGAGGEKSAGQNARESTTSCKLEGPSDNAGRICTTRTDYLAPALSDHN